MRTHSVPPHLSPPPGGQPKPASKPPRTLDLQTDDFEKLIHRLPKEKQNYARGLFPKDATGRSMRIDENSFKAFMNILDRKEQKSFEWLLPKLKDSSRFDHERTPEAHHPSKGDDLPTPIGIQG